MQLTLRQREVLIAIEAYTDARGESPTYQWLGDCCCARKETIWEHVSELVRKGYIKVDANKARGIQIVKRAPRNATQFAVVGTVDCRE